MQFIENKIPPPLVALMCASLMWLIARTDTIIGLSFIATAAIAGFLVLIGTVFAIGGMISFAQSKTTVNPLKPETASSLVTTGVYQVTRNPMYVGLAMFLLAWAVILGSAWSLLGVGLFVVFIQRFQILPEERALKQLFGEEFDSYTHAVRRWL